MRGQFFRNSINWLLPAPGEVVTEFGLRVEVDFLTDEARRPFSAGIKAGVALEAIHGDLYCG